MGNPGDTGLVLGQGLLLILMAPGVIGLLRRVKSRLLQARAPAFWQPYVDLWKLLHKRPALPDRASWLFSLVPAVVLVGYALPAFGIPVIGLPIQDRAGTMDLLLVLAFWGLARLMTALGGMDSGSGLAGMGSSREMFVHVIAEPILLLIVGALALYGESTHLFAIVKALREDGSLPFFKDLTLLLVLFALLVVLQLEVGRPPFDDPELKLELMMLGRAAHLPYSGPGLALLEWAEAVRFTLLATLLLDLVFPAALAVPGAGWATLAGSALLYPIKLGALIVILAVFEANLGKLPLNSIADPAILALVFAFLALILAMVKSLGGSEIGDGPLMVRILTFVMLSIAIIISATRSVELTIDLYRVQSLILAGVTWLVMWKPEGEVSATHSSFGILLAAVPFLLAIFVKGLLAQATVPQSEGRPASRNIATWLRWGRYFLRDLPRQAKPIWLERESRSHSLLGALGFDLFLVILAYVVAFKVIGSRSGMGTGSGAGIDPYSLAISLALLMVGLSTMARKRNIISQVLGLLVMDQGMFLAAIQLIAVSGSNSIFVWSLLLSMICYTFITLIILISLLPNLRSASDTSEVGAQNILKEG